MHSLSVWLQHSMQICYHRLHNCLLDAMEPGLRYCVCCGIYSVVNFCSRAFGKTLISHDGSTLATTFMLHNAASKALL